MRISDSILNSFGPRHGEKLSTLFGFPFRHSAMLPLCLSFTQLSNDATNRAKWAFRLSALLVFCLLIGGCAEDYYVYGIDDVEITPVNSEKDKAKTHSQYISILYANMFQKAIGPNQMLEALKAVESIGDKQVAYDMLVSKYMNDPQVIIPSNESMREDPETFIRDTYTRFLVRQPTEAELQWMINYIESRPAVTAELVYFSFATSNEHFHY